MLSDNWLLEDIYSHRGMATAKKEKSLLIHSLYFKRGAREADDTLWCSVVWVFFLSRNFTLRVFSLRNQDSRSLQEDYKRLPSFQLNKFSQLSLFLQHEVGETWTNAMDSGFMEYFLFHWHLTAGNGCSWADLGTLLEALVGLVEMGLLADMCWKPWIHPGSMDPSFQTGLDSHPHGSEHGSSLQPQQETLSGLSFSDVSFLLKNQPKNQCVLAKKNISMREEWADCAGAGPYS